MTRFNACAVTFIATALLLTLANNRSSHVAASSDDSSALFASYVSFGDSQVTTDRFNVRGFVPTGSMSTNCLTTLAESNNAIPGVTVFCAPREYLGQKGVLVSAFFPKPIPSGLYLSATVYQQDAHEYGTPVFYPGI